MMAPVSRTSYSLLLQLMIFFAVIMYYTVPTTMAQSFFPYAECSTTSGNFTNNSSYQTTLTSLFSSMSSSLINYNFFNASLTTDDDEKVTAMGFCRGDVPPVACQTCLQTSASDVRQLCPNQEEAIVWNENCTFRYSNRYTILFIHSSGSIPSETTHYELRLFNIKVCRNFWYFKFRFLNFRFQKEAIVWNENCTFRYSNRSILNTDETDPDYQLMNTKNASNQDQFNAALQSLLGDIRSVAAAGGPLRKLATSNASVGFQTIYALVQCTPDLSEQQCTDCMVTIIGRIPQCCAGKMGGRVMAPSCYLRFETNDRFFDDPAGALPSPPPPFAAKAPPPAPTTPPPGGKNNSTIIIVVVVSVTSAIIIGIITCILLRKKNKQKPTVVENGVTEDISTPESLQFDLQTVRVATDDFSNEKMLGRGGFGAVYKGMLPNGLEIAVKRLARNSGQGELEFKNEVTLLARLQHRNLVRLLGFCLEGIERLLIYEYVPNSSLDHFLFDPVKRGLLNWEKRHKIILGIARGLLYLHEDSRLRIIHRDMKASNVLLDESMNPKISDFGMARLFTQDQTRADTNRIVGTYGYMSPEYAMHGNFSLKSDVYSFGVMVLEIVSGQRNNSLLDGERAEDLITSAWRNWREGTIEKIIDSYLDCGSRSEMARCIHIGLLCVQENVSDRPTMATVGLMLSSHSMTLQVPSQPGLLMRMGVGSSTTSTSSEGRQSGTRLNQFSYNEVTLTEPYPR